MLISYRKFRKIHHASMRYVAVLALANLLSYAPSFFGPQTDTSSAMCQSQAFLFLLFQLSSIFWTVALSLTLLIIVYRPFADVSDYSRGWHVLCWGVPLILSITALATRRLGDAPGAFCFFLEPIDEFIFFWLWLWIAFVLFLVVYVLARKRLSELSRTELSVTAQKNLLDRGNRAVRRLGPYPLLLFVVWLVPSIIRFYEFAHPDSYVFWAHVVVVILIRMQGVGNAFLYGANKKLIAELGKTPWFGKLFFYLCVLARHDKSTVTGSAPRVVHRQLRDDEEIAGPSRLTDDQEVEMQQI